MAKTHATCTRCGRTLPINVMTRTTLAKRGDGGSYMCERCASVNERYHTTNDAILGTDKKNAVFCGIEFETSFTDDYARNTLFEYSFIPTHDGSLHSDGNGQRYGWYDENTCEYVSGLMKGLNRASKFALTCDYLMADGHMSINSSCGTHFHVSIDSMKDANGNHTYMSFIRRFYHSLFIPLTEAMKRDPQKTVAVFGRNFSESYAKVITENSRPKEDRYLWINVLADTNIEFRINKFANGKQYQNLMKMEVEMVKCIITNFCEHFNDEITDTRRYPTKTAYRKHKADVTAEKLVKIFEKFSENI